MEAIISNKLFFLVFGVLISLFIFFITKDNSDRCITIEQVYSSTRAYSGGVIESISISGPHYTIKGELSDGEKFTEKGSFSLLNFYKMARIGDTIYKKPGVLEFYLKSSTGIKSYTMNCKE